MSADPRRMCIVQGGRDVETDSRKESPGRCSLHRVHRWTAGARSRSCVLGAGELSFLPSLFGGHVEVLDSWHITQFQCSTWDVYADMSRSKHTLYDSRHDARRRTAEGERLLFVPGFAFYL